MHLKVEEPTKVDRKIHIHADATDLAPRISEGLKKARRMAQFPGFRVGQAPMGLVEKRFGAEIRQEEAGKFVEEVLRDKIFPEFNPIGQPVLEDMHFHGDELHAIIRIALKPQINLVDLKTVTVERMVHDVSEADVDLEIGFVLRRQAEWVEAETVSAESKLTVHSQELDADGKPTDAPLEINVSIDLNERGNANLVAPLTGKKKGDKAVVSYEDNGQRFELEIVAIQDPKKPELTDEWVKTATNGEAEDVETYRVRIKSRIQDYYDQLSRDFGKRQLQQRLVELHSFDVPELIVDRVMQDTFERMHKEQGEKFRKQLEDPAYVENARAQAKRSVHWMLLAEAIREANAEALKVTEDDIQNFMQKKADEYGIPVEYLSQVYAKTEDAMRRLYTDMEDEKLFNFLFDEVTTVEIPRDEYLSKYKQFEA